MSRPTANVQVSFEIEVRDRDGRIIKRISGASRSFVSSFLQWLLTGFVSTPYTFKDRTGTDREVLTHIPAQTGVDVEFVNMDVRGPADDVNYGILVGYGTTSPTPGDYNLESPAPNTELKHYETTLEVYEVSGNETRATFKRVFENVSGADKTINELGLAAKYYRKVGTDVRGPWYFLLIRDVLSTGQTVPAGATVTVRYRIKTVT